MGKKSKEKKARQKIKLQDNKEISSAFHDDKGLNDSEIEKHLNRYGIKNTFIHILLIFVICCIAYAGTYNSPFHLDDEYSISKNPVISDLNYFIDPQSVKDLPNGKFFYSALQSRYLGSLTFAINYKIHGLDVTGFHIVNVFIHFINSALVYFFILLLFNTLPLKASVLTQHKKLLALSSALIFTAHPVQTQAVTYIVQRFTSLATLFYLASVIMYLCARFASTDVSAGKKEQRNKFKTKLLYAGAILCTVCAMKTKEIAFTLPFTLMTIEWIFFKSSLSKRILWLMPFLSSLLIIPASMINLDQPFTDIISAASESARVQSPLSRLDYFYTQLRVIITYIRLLFLPINQNLDYVYPVYNSFSDPNVFLSGFLIVTILSLAGFSLYRYGASKPASKLAVFGIFWFFITLSVESSIIPIKDVIFEHRLYLPSVGFFITLTTLIYILFLRLKERWQNSGILLFGTILSVVIALTFSAYARNKVWQDEISLWEDVLEKSPDNERGHKNLGSAYTAKNQRSKARKHFEICIKLNDQDLTCHYNLGVIYHQMGIIDFAIKKYEKALQLKKAFVDSPYIYSDINFNLGLAYQSKKLHYKAIQHFQSSIKIKPNDPNAHNDIGVSYLKVGLMDNAKKHFQTAVRLSPGYKEAQRNLRRTYLK